MEKKKVRICHFTSAHESHDDRIYLKECISLKEAGYDVYLVAKGESAVEKGIKIIGCGLPRNRSERIVSFSRKVYRKARDLECDIYHFHDPELLPYGLKLKKQGKRVIFDSHEDVPAQILDKHWIPFFLRRLISVAYKAYESYVARRIDAVVAATPHIAEQFEGRAAKTEVINNYPKLDDIVFHDTPFEQREAIICYAGGIDELRGEKVMVEAMKGLEATLVLAGEHEKMDVGEVIYLGRIDREGINELYGNAIAGLVTLLPIKNYFFSQPIKMFEYMAAGLPVIASDFPHWKRIMEENGCGICVDPTSEREVRQACRKLADNPQLGQEMGRNGRKAVIEKYHWGKEERKLVSFYRQLVGEE